MNRDYKTCNNNNYKFILFYVGNKWRWLADDPN